MVVLIAMPSPVEASLPSSNTSVVIPMATRPPMEETLLLLNASVFYSGSFLLCPRPRPRPRLQACISFMVGPLRPRSKPLMVVPKALAFTWEATWWLLFKLQLQQSNYLSVAQSSIRGPIAYASNRRLVRSSIRLQAPTMPLHHRRRARRHRTHHYVCCIYLVYGPLGNFVLLRGPSCKKID
jgi:hypothetical protein